VLGDEGPHRGQLEHLTALDVHELRIAQVAATASARRGRVNPYVVGDLHLGQMLAIGPGLLAGASLCGASFGPVGNGRLGEPLG
jgi:hypothetical protein